MNKLKMETEDLTLENIEKLKELFPSVVSDGKIDFDKLKQELSADIVKSSDSYDFTWVGKHDAVRKANEPVNAVLRPCPEESKNWEKTKNVYIEGDNLDVLKILYKSYAGKIKMIYIDPPYNTGNDFIYDDNFAQSLTEYRDNSHLSDEQGRQLKKLTNANGKYHSDWCSMMYPRLKLARKLLSDDGVIFISIDDHEVANLKKICDEVFGESNCLGLISVVNNLKGRSDSEFFATCNEFVVVYSKNRIFAHTNGFELDVEEIDDDYKFEDEISKYKLIGFRKTGNGWKREDRPYMYYPVLEKDGFFSTVERDECIKIYNLERKCFNDEYVDELRVKYEQGGYKFILPKDEKGAYGRWRWGLETFFKEKDVNLAFNSAGTLCTKMRATIEDGSIRVKTAKTLWYKPEYDTGTSEKILKLLFAKNIFNNPKSQIYISDILKVGSNVDSIILDFFSGSATTAHAVMQLNAEDGGNRKFIMVQLPEVCDEKSEAYKAGYKNICEIGKERIRRAGEKIISETGKTDLDVGFRVFKLDSSNMKDVYFTPAELIQKEGADIEDLADNVKPDRNAADLLFGVMQYWNMTECLSAPHKTKEIDGFTIHIVQDGQYPELVACFDADVPETVITEMAKLNPLRAVFRERCFKTTQDRLNAERLLKNADIRLI